MKKTFIVEGLDRSVGFLTIQYKDSRQSRRFSRESIHIHYASRFIAL